MGGDSWTDSPKADFCYRFVRRLSDTVEIAGSHGRLGGGDCESTNTEQAYYGDRNQNHYHGRV